MILNDIFQSNIKIKDQLAQVTRAYRAKHDISCPCVCVCVCVCVTIDLFANIFKTTHHIILKFCNLIVKAIAEIQK